METSQCQLWVAVSRNRHTLAVYNRRDLFQVLTVGNYFERILKNNWIAENKQSSTILSLWRFKRMKKQASFLWQICQKPVHNVVTFIPFVQSKDLVACLILKLVDLQENKQVWHKSTEGVQWSCACHRGILYMSMLRYVQRHTELWSCPFVYLSSAQIVQQQCSHPLLRLLLFLT